MTMHPRSAPPGPRSPGACTRPLPCSWLDPAPARCAPFPPAVPQQHVIQEYFPRRSTFQHGTMKRASPKWQEQVSPYLPMR
eukprot:810227-Rhodomonas_salina.4